MKLFAPSAILLLCLNIAPGQDAGLIPAPSFDSTTSPTLALSDPLADSPRALLDLAFHSISKMPIQGHGNERSRYQQKVLVAALEAGRFELVDVYLDGIIDWRKNESHALIARAHARAGNRQAAERHLDLARHLEVRGESWQKERVQIAIVEALAALGEQEKSELYAVWISEGERGSDLKERIAADKAVDFQAQLAIHERLTSSSNVDLVRNGMEANVGLFDRFYQDFGLRDEAEARIRNGWETLPVFARIDLLIAMADVSLKHNHSEKALQFAGEIEELVSLHGWEPQDRIGLAARAAGLRHRAGDVDTALANLQLLQEDYKSVRDRIPDIWRGDALRPIAEAHVTAGRLDLARELYDLALTEATTNPNARPRAKDMVEICSSMVTNGFTPDAAMWARLSEASNELREPW